MSTRVRTWILVAALSSLLVVMGTLVGGAAGLVVAALLAVAFNVGMYWFSDRIALRMARARPLEAGELPEVVADVEDLSARAGLPVPRLYVIPGDQPNAFATGRNPRHSAVAVTEGLVRLLPREQVRAVIAHELAHVRNRDVLSRPSPRRSRPPSRASPTCCSSSGCSVEATRRRAARPGCSARSRR